jgi:hypothetical protein
MHAREGDGATRCERCGKVPETLYQFWTLVPGEKQLSKAAIRSLPEFCGHACWVAFINGAGVFDGATREVSSGIPL